MKCTYESRANPHEKRRTCWRCRYYEICSFHFRLPISSTIF